MKSFPRRRLIIEIGSPWFVVWNMALALVVMCASRAVFVLYNSDLVLADVDSSRLFSLMLAGEKFDLATLGYLNAAYIFIAFFPLSLYIKPCIYRGILKWYYVIVNSIAVVVNLADVVFYRFRGSRTTAVVFQEFQSEGNIGAIVWTEIVNNLVLVVVAVVLVGVLWLLYASPKPVVERRRRLAAWLNTAYLVVSVPLVLIAIRGNFFRVGVHPLYIEDAAHYARNLEETSIVLNTPFSIIKSANSKTVPTPQYFTPDEVKKYYTSLHMIPDSVEERQPNIVVILLESFSSEFVGALNKNKPDLVSYTPFLDSLIERSLTFEHSFSNGYISIDAVPSVFVSIPRVRYPFVYTPYALDHLDGLPAILKRKGYETAFFLGADDSSLGIHAFCNTIGFNRYYSIDDYYEKVPGGRNLDITGSWGIWDEEFLQFFADELDELGQPFLAGFFTLSSHHPFALPERYENEIAATPHPIQRTVLYTDMALRRFFETASGSPWFDNTVFVLCADHAFMQNTRDEYKTTLGKIRIPIIFYDPSGRYFSPETKPVIAQQIDIMPSLLHLVGHHEPFVAFGKNLFTTESADNWAFNGTEYRQFITPNYLLQTDDSDNVQVYDIINDPLLQTDLSPCWVDSLGMQNRLKALLQDYYHRLNTDTMR